MFIVVSLHRYVRPALRPAQCVPTDEQTTAKDYMDITPFTSLNIT